MDRIKRLSVIVLKDNKAKFGTDFNENKNTLDSLSTITSKSLRNRVAGYITRLLKNELIELEKTENMKSQQQAEEQNEPAVSKADDIAVLAPLEPKETIAVKHSKVHDGKDSTTDNLNTKIED